MSQLYVNTLYSLQLLVYYQDAIFLSCMCFFTCAFQLFYLFCLVHDKLLRRKYVQNVPKCNVAVAKMTIFFSFVSEKIGSKIKVHISISLVIKK